MNDASSFTKLVPGFDFLQGLVKNAGAALPGIGQWVAPTIDPAELEKRIEELRTVQFWLEQNAKMMGATIQALEVQRMTLSTLKTMNVQMEGLRDSLKIRVPQAATPAATAAAGAALELPTPPLSFIAVVASSVNCFVSAPHHCIGSTTPGAAGVGSGVGSGAASAAAVAAGVAACGTRIFSESRRPSICTFIVYSA